jgi:hypothetical protein
MLSARIGGSGMQFGQLKRREMIALLGGAAATWPLRLWAQPAGRVPKIGILAWGNELQSPAIDSFRRELRNLGYLEGRDVTIEFRGAAGNPAGIAGLAAELVQMPVDVIVSDGTPATTDRARCFWPYSWFISSLLTARDGPAAYALAISLSFSGMTRLSFRPPSSMTRG